MHSSQDWPDASCCLGLHSDNGQVREVCPSAFSHAWPPSFCRDDSGNESLLHSGLLHISKHTSTLSVDCGELRASNV